MNHTLKNPFESTGALIEGRDITDVDFNATIDQSLVHGNLDVLLDTDDVVHNDNVTTLDTFVPKNGKCYIQINGTDARKMNVTTMTGKKKVATFLPGVNIIGIMYIHKENSETAEFSVIE